MTNTDEKIGRILEKLESIDEKIEKHLTDYSKTKSLVYTMKERQLAAACLIIGLFGSGAGALAWLAKIVM